MSFLVINARMSRNDKQASKKRARKRFSAGVSAAAAAVVVAPTLAEYLQAVVIFLFQTKNSNARTLYFKR